MKIFDFNIHLPFLKNEDVNLIIEQDMNLDLNGIEKGFELHKDKIKNLDGINILLFNTNLEIQKDNKVFKSINKEYDFVKYTSLIDFRKENVFDYIDHLKIIGINSIMFNSYLQKIAESDFPMILKICKYASSLGFIICIDGSYGTSKMYVYDNLKLVCYISDFINKTPIVIVHAGGRRIIDAMLLSVEKKNVWLDSSFSLPYYIGSSIEIDFSFAFKKMNTEKIIFGSDHPYTEFSVALNTHLDFFERHKFTQTQIENIFFTNALSLFGE